MNTVTRHRRARVHGPDVTHRSKETPTVMTPDHRLFPLRTRRQDGFTLIELLVVIVILGVLAAIVVFSVRGIGDKGRKEAVAADAATLRTAEEAYCAKHGHYGTIDDLKADGLLTGEPVYNMVAVGQESKCGRGAKSSFTLYDNSPTQHTAKPIAVGANATDLAVDEKADRVYVVSNAGSVGSTVTVIDGKTDETIGTPIDVSGAVSNPTRIAVNSGTGHVYVGGNDSVAVIDTAGGNQVTRVAFPVAVSGLAVSPENGDVYVGGGVGGNSVVSYIPSGASSATRITLPGAGIAAAAAGMEFTFDPARHMVYFAKPGTGLGTSPHSGLYGISTQTHEARLVAELQTKATACTVSNYGHLIANSVRGSTVFDPNRNLVYLFASRCVLDPTATNGRRNVGTTIVINPDNGSSTAIDEGPGSTYGHLFAVYSPSAASVYLFSKGSSDVPECPKSGGRLLRIEGAEAKNEAPACEISTALANPAHKVAVLKNFNRVFVPRYYADGAAPGGIGVTDGTTMLTQAALGAPRHFGSLAVNDTTGKLYAIDPANKTVEVFRTGAE
ncbi:prepilin-type N-terminal cleavage/methylation domain-containing protein [Streptomyces erythrochromogenes]|uniref:prepilin-type N-terminal cleavage/methylation domain-containing protein n=1 Tax=Streptomyces erythrochromogenes TaxID=285574 RepID=UPI003320149E